MYKYRVLAVTRISPTVIQLKLQAITKNIEFFPGQYAAISFRRFGRPTPVRCFSISSSPIDKQILEFSMRIYGNYTRAVQEIRIGDKVKILGPFGNFVLDEDHDKNVLMLAGGIGITPFMSMIRYATEISLKSRITLIYSCKTQDDIPFYEDLLKLEILNPRFKVAFYISDGVINKLHRGKIFTGNINKKIISNITTTQSPLTSFICGPPPFMETMKQNLLDLGMEDSDIILEGFGQTASKSNVSIGGRSVNSVVYGLTALAMVFATGFIGLIDLARAVPKIENIQNSEQTTPSSTTTSAPVITVTTPTTSTSSSTSTTSGTTTQVVQTPTYQQAVTSVS